MLKRDVIINGLLNQSHSAVDAKEARILREAAQLLNMDADLRDQYEAAIQANARISKAQAMDDEGWISERRINEPIQKTDLKCACGGNVFSDVIEFRDSSTANRLFCTNCGAQMRSSGSDKDGEWLRDRWMKTMRDVIAMPKEHEAHVMGFSDIQTASKVDVYLEDRGSDLVYPLMLLGAENSNKSQAVFFHPMTVKPLSAYGKTWRCWTCRPSQKQREETPWE